MKRKTNLPILALVLTAAVLIQACAPSPAPLSGHGSRQVVLKPDLHDKSLLWWEIPGFNWHRYHSIFLSPVTLELSEKNRASLTHEDLDGLKKEVRNTLIKTLSPEYPLVTEKGPGVLELQITITKVETANPALNLLTTLAVFVPVDMGGASVEVAFFDTLTGKQVAAMADTKTGTPFQFSSGFTRMGHARAALGKWAQELKTALAENP